MECPVKHPRVSTRGIFFTNLISKTPFHPTPTWGEARQGGNARPTARPVLSKAPVEIEVGGN